MGLGFVAFFLIAMTVYSSGYGVSLFFNNYMDWYYGLGYLITLIPLQVGLCLFVFNFTAKTRSGRNLLTTGVVLAVFTILINWLWEMVYINTFLKT